MRQFHLLVLAFSRSFGLLLTSDTGLFVMFSLAKFGLYTASEVRSLESFKRTVNGFVFFDLDFSHPVFPPSANARICYTVKQQMILYQKICVLSRELKSFLCGFDEICESLFICDSELGKHLSVEIDAGLLETVDELAVINAVLFAGCRDSGDPESTEVSLFHLSAGESVVTALHHLLFRHFKMSVFIAPITLRELQDLLSSFSRCESRFDSCHFILPPEHDYE